MAERKYNQVPTPEEIAERTKEVRESEAFKRRMEIKHRKNGYQLPTYSIRIVGNAPVAKEVD